MYVFYEHHKNDAGEIVATDVAHSSYPTGKGVQWRYPEEKGKHELLLTIYKQVPIASRTFDPELKVWTFLSTNGLKLVNMLIMQMAHGILKGLIMKEVEDLIEQLEAGGIRENYSKKSSFNPQDFFYNSSQPATQSALTKESVLSELSKLLECSSEELAIYPREEAKKLYRKACLRLHPDRNNGDGSRMSQLNMLWQVYNA